MWHATPSRAVLSQQFGFADLVALLVAARRPFGLKQAQEVLQRLLPGRHYRDLRFRRLRRWVWWPAGLLSDRCCLGEWQETIYPAVSQPLTLKGTVPFSLRENRDSPQPTGISFPAARLIGRADCETGAFHVKQVVHRGSLVLFTWNTYTQTVWVLGNGRFT